MNGSTASLDSLLSGLMKSLSVLGLTRCGISVFPSLIHLMQVVKKLQGFNVGVGAQDVDQRNDGAVTSGVSATMLKDAGAKFVLVGHSERRRLFFDSDEVVARKFEQVKAVGLVPIVCVGETRREREEQRTIEVVSRQLKAVTSHVGAKGFDGAIIAYEPVWSIGSGESATPEQAEGAHAGLRESLARLDEGLSERTRILYGGSVTARNAGALFDKKNVDGALVGGASLDANSFADICRAAEES